MGVGLFSGGFFSLSVLSLGLGGGLVLEVAWLGEFVVGRCLVW